MARRERDGAREETTASMIGTKREIVVAKRGGLFAFVALSAAAFVPVVALVREDRTREAGKEFARRRRTTKRRIGRVKRLHEQASD